MRPFEPQDAPALQAYLNRAELAGRRYVPWGFSEEAPLSSAQVASIITRWGEEEAGLNLAVTLREGGDLIGHALCEWEWDPHAPFTAVVIHPDHQRRGYGSEVLGLLLRYLFYHTPAHNVSSEIASWNLPALVFAGKLGFREAGRNRREGLRGGAYFDGVVVDLLRHEWKGG